MTGKLTFRVDGYRVPLFTYPAPGTARRRTGRKSADVEISIDLDALREQLVRDALCTKSCKLTRLQGAIIVKPIKGTVTIAGDGKPSPI